MPRVTRRVACWGIVHGQKRQTDRQECLTVKPTNASVTETLACLLDISPKRRGCLVFYFSHSQTAKHFGKLVCSVYFVFHDGVYAFH